MFDIALGIFLFLSPIFFLPIQIGNVNALQFYQFGVLGNGGYNYLQLLFFEVAVISLFIISLLSKPQREFNDKWIVILLSIFCLSVYFHPIGIKMIAPILLGFLLYYLVVVYTKDYKKLFKFIFLASLLNTIFAVLQYFHISPIFRCDPILQPKNVIGFMNISTHLGVYQAMVVPVCYAINPFLVIIPIIGVILSQSMAAIIIMVCWIIFKLCQMIKHKKIVSVPLVLVIIFSILIFISHNYGLFMAKFSSRFLVWKPIVKEIINHPFLGCGIKPLRIDSVSGLWERHFNIYLEAVHYLGIFVLIPIFMIVKKVITSKNRILLASILIALLVGLEKSIFDFPRLAGTVIILFGLLTITEGEKNHVATI